MYRTILCRAPHKGLSVRVRGGSNGERGVGRGGKKRGEEKNKEDKDDDDDEEEEMAEKVLECRPFV